MPDRTDVGGHHVVPSGIRRVEDAPAAGDAGIVDEQGQRPKGAFGLVQGLGDGSGVGHVHGQRRDVGRRGRKVVQPVVAAGGSHHLGAMRGENLREAAAEAR